MKTRYITPFHLTGSVNDYYAACEYLEEDDMTQYVPDDIRPLLISVHWELLHLCSGYIIVDAKQELSQDILDRLSSWISGQNSDGLGEGFEQQDFAREYEDPDDEYSDSWMCSFDWDENNYKLVRFEDAPAEQQDEIKRYIGNLE